MGSVISITAWLISDALRLVRHPRKPLVMSWATGYRHRFFGNSAGGHACERIARSGHENALFAILGGPTVGRLTYALLSAGVSGFFKTF
jgi:hypothetical protein